jgi:16S rRNA C1402 (ribose-2'-O) methylase RsmI
MKDNKEKKEKNKRKEKLTDNEAVIIIQAVYRGYYIRKTFEKLLKKAKKRLFIAKEILSTEEVYLTSLNATVSV